MSSLLPILWWSGCALKGPSACTEADLEASRCGDPDRAFRSDDPTISNAYSAEVYAVWKETALAVTGMTEAEFDADYTVDRVTRETTERVDRFGIEMTLHADWSVTHVTPEVLVAFDEWAKNPETELQDSVNDSFDSVPIHDVGPLLCWSDLLAILAACEAELGAAPGSFVLDPCSGFLWDGNGRFGGGKLAMRAYGEVDFGNNECGIFYVDVEDGIVGKCEIQNCYDK